MRLECPGCRTKCPRTAGAAIVETDRSPDTTQEDPMTPSEPTDNDVPPGAVDVVDGPVGSAWLKEPEPPTSKPIDSDPGTLPSGKSPVAIDDSGSDGDSGHAIDRP
jgi:hypothetical protein